MEEEIDEEEETEDTESQDEDDEFEDEETTREIVVPGEVLTEDTENYIPGRGTILNKSRDKILSVLLGLKQIKRNYVNVIPLKGFYTAHPGDKVIAIVVDKNPVKYRCDINAKDQATLKPKNTIKRGRLRGSRRESLNTEKYDIGDVLVVKVLSADRLNKPELTTVGKYLGKKTGGIIISIDPPKVPRVIGRNGSMIKMLKKLTNSNIFVTQNGRIWIKGEDIENERLLIEAIYKIENEAHTRGLTDRIQEFIEYEKQKRGIE
ncbi:MAG: Exosome complex component Rrp4 [Promethearchaeota archaeon]|nr:MAG: Exosome complex component Rrp4 [Candidatus Lokiarchaeota archaeon]